MSEGNVTQSSVRQLVTGIYDLQKLRIQTGNRIVQQFRHKLGLSSSDKEEDDKAAAEMLAAIRKEYDRLTDGLLDSGKRMARVNAFTSDGLVTNEVEFAHVEMYMFLLDKEKKAFASLERFLKDVPIFATFLSKVGGCGPAMAGAIICCLDPHKARNVSSFWRYAGLDVGPDGKGRSMRAEHLVDREFIGRDGEKSVRKGITFNKWL